VLDAIWMALAGAAGAKETTRPIRDGEEKASVELDLGDLTVRRRWTASGTTLEVAAADGARYPSPQTLLDGLIGRLTFDPLAFAEQDARHQRQMLLEVLELPFDPDKVAAKRQTAYDDRTVVNRDVKRLEAQVAGMPAVPDDTPDDEVSAAELVDELQQAKDAARKAEAFGLELERAGREVDRLEEELRAAHEAVARLHKQQEEMADPPDPAPIQERLAGVDATNAYVRLKRERARLQEELEGARERSKKLTAQLAKIDADTAAAIAAASMPLEGLSFDDEGVLYQGVPFSQASSAERLRVSIAVAMALNPKIRVLRITDGSLLDTENLALIEQMAGDHDFQIWIERVDETGKVGVVIEDGQVLGSDGSAASPTKEEASQ
jgi:predicted  nucleic acid-binding Zn-ribbon protein